MPRHQDLAGRIQTPSRHRFLLWAEDHRLAARQLSIGGLYAAVNGLLRGIGEGMAGDAMSGLIDTGTHRTTWTLSKPPGTEVWDVSGEVDLQGMRQPAGTVFGTAPVNWTVTGGSVGAGFPQHFNYPLVHGEMNGNLDVVLIDAHLTVFGEHPREGLGSFKAGNAYFNAWAALVGRDAPRNGPVLVDSGVIQVPYLESFVGKSPIAEITFPRGVIYQQDEPKFTATFDKGSLQEWSDDGAEVSVYYNISADINGFHHFGLTFSPVVSVELTKPVTLAEFLTEWVFPLRGLVASAVGEKVDINHLTCSPVIEGDTRRQFQVFNASISQAPYASTNSLKDKHVSAIRLASDGESLLRLLRKWQELRVAENPILNTYDITAVGRGQHPRARFLLLIQALEGLYGYERRSEERHSRFASERESMLARCKDNLESTVFKFVKKHLSKRPPLGVDSVLREMLQALPIDLEAELTDGALVKSVRSQFPTVTSTLDAIRIVRNDLSHGNRTYDRHALAEAADILERVVRGHLLRLLDASDEIVRRVLSPDS